MSTCSMSRHRHDSGLCEPEESSLSSYRSTSDSKSRSLDGRVRIFLVSVFIVSLFCQINLTMTTFGYVLFTSYRILGPCMSFKYYHSTPDCPDVDLTWTGLFPCDLGWRGSAVALFILATFFLTFYYIVTTCLQKWNTRRQFTINFRKPSVFESQDRGPMFQERVQSTNDLLTPTLSLCLVLMAFHLLLQSGDVESNPGPNCAYEVMVAESEKIVEGISRDPKGWATSLHSKGFISDDLKDETLEINEIKTDKARKLHSALLKIVKEYPKKFDEFISLLHNKGSLYTDLRSILTKKLGELESSDFDKEVVEESMEVYRSYLANIYDVPYLPVDDKYPLACTKRFVNLECADISKRLSRKELDEAWSDIARGNLHKFPREKISLNRIAVKKDDKFPKLVLMIGAPGVGKTTLSWELCRQWANGQFWTDYSLVILLRLRDESTQNATELIDLIQFGHIGISRSVDSFMLRKQGHGVLFILEGLDELPESLRLDSIFTKLITGRLLPASTVLLTTRPWAVKDLPYSCGQRMNELIDILGFSPEQIREYIDLMIEDGTPAELRQYIDSNPNILSSMYNPLHARIIVEIYKENYEYTNSVLPNTTTEVYCNYSRILIQRHLQAPPGVKRIRIEKLDDLPSSIQSHFDKLCDIAYRGITNEKQQLVFFKEDIQDTDDTLGFMNSVHPLHQSILTKNASPSYNFIHLTLQEFLAAFHIQKHLTPQEQLILFITKENDGLYRMILKFLAGLTGFKDSWTRCVFPIPHFYYKQEGSSRIERVISYSKTLWFYESQNLSISSSYKKTKFDLHLGMEGKYDNYLFALGYFLSSNASISLLELTASLFSENDQSMFLGGMNNLKAYSLDSPLIRVKHLKVVVANSLLPYYLRLKNMILPQVEEFSLTTMKNSNFIPESDKKPIMEPQASVEVLYDLLKPFSALKLLDIDFNASRETMKELLNILKAKKCLKTLKYTLFSCDDEELLSDFVKHSTIETLVVKINIRLSVACTNMILSSDHYGDYISIISVDTERLHFLSIGLDVFELQKNSSRVIPASLSEFPIPIEVLPQFKKEIYSWKRFVEPFSVKKLISIIDHWKLSLKSLSYSICPNEVHLYHPASLKFFRTLFTCPLLEEVVVGFSDSKRAVLGEYPDVSPWVYSFAGLKDVFCFNQKLHTLSLYSSFYLSELFDSLNYNHLLKSLKLGCLFNSQFDTDIKDYLLSNDSLEELELVHETSPCWSNGLMLGLKHNTCLRKLIVSKKTRSCLRKYGADKEASILMASVFRLNNTLRFLKCELPLCYPPQFDLPLMLEALSTNKTLQHLELFHELFEYILTAKEAEALGKMLSANNALEVFHCLLEITFPNCEPIVKGLLDNKTLKEICIHRNTEKYIAKCPDYIQIRNKIRYLEY